MNEDGNLKLAARLLETGRLVSAESIVRDHLDKCPDDGLAWMHLTDILSALGRYATAKVALDRAASLCPDGHKCLVLFRYGHLCKQQGDYSGAEQYYQSAMDHRPQDAAYGVFLGGLLLQWGRLKDAVIALRRATECRYGAIDEAFLNLGFALRGLEQYESARQCFEKAILIDPDYVEATDALDDLTPTDP